MHQVKGRVKIAADNHITPALRVPAFGVPRSREPIAVSGRATRDVLWRYNDIVCGLLLDNDPRG